MAGFIFIKASLLLQSATQLQTCRSAERTGTDVLLVSIGGEFPLRCLRLVWSWRQLGRKTPVSGQRRSVRQCHRSAFLLYELSVSFCQFVSTVCLHTLRIDTEINLLNAKLNPICHLMALIGAHIILHVSRIRVNEFRVL